MISLLSVSGVSVSFDGFKAINNLSFTIGPAELRAVIGPNGAGKTTFMDIITGKTRPDEGPLAALFFSLSGQGRQRILDLAEQVGLVDHLGRKAGELSHGQKQWLEIAMLLAQAPRLLLVDEPAAGMTLAERERTTAMLVELAKTCAVVVVEHDMDFIRRLNCRVTVLHEGSVLAEGSLDHVTKTPAVIDVYLGRG
jgi:urea transport system ATP-binding protein